MLGDTKLIAEVADNHGGDMKLAKHFIKTLADIGVDIVKLQSWQMERVRDPKEEPFYDWLTGAELQNEQHMELKEYCEEVGVEFLTSVFDKHRIEFLGSLGTRSIKVPSPELSNYELLLGLKEHFDHIIVSTGMHVADEVVAAAKLLEGANYTFLHCVSIYPSTVEQANLSRMEWLKQFTPSVGLSDHCGDLESAKMALLLGADYIERHTALGKYGPGRVNAWDTYPEKWEELVAYRERVRSAWGVGPDLPLTDGEEAARTRFIGRWSGGE